ncbi:MAG: quinohemoprotein amine dehydrogenase subunit alpha [Proteobacteria bacterium]|nr:MAG: quinohemoprotein amine dehydrogenase subunit alpha [Pseudomonadota bacterium]
MRLPASLKAMVIAAVLLALAGCGEDKKAEAPAPLTLRDLGAEVVARECSLCHRAAADGSLSRLSGIRKTPEGWEMTLARMESTRGVKLSPQDRRAAVKFLADTQGLTPPETAPYRYELERRPHVVESGHNADVMSMCARCHAFARVALQRRDAEEWRLLFHTHLGLWPTLEYQALARDRDWWEEAQGWVATALGKYFPYDTPAWREWAAAPAVDLQGRWRFVGYMPGEGFADGIMTVTRNAIDEYGVAAEEQTTGGAAINVNYAAIVYSKYEWRGRGKLDNREFYEVAALNADGVTMTGRTYWIDAPEVGSNFVAVRADRGLQRPLAVTNEGLKRGASTEITILGVGMKGEVSLGDGVAVRVTSRSEDKIIVMAEVATDATLGRRDVRVGDAVMAQAVAVYDKIDRIEVAPGQATARLGSDKIAPVSAQFEAVAYASGDDGIAGTDDDFRIGVVAAAWDIAPYDAEAARMKDHLYAGKITPRGRFLPSEAGRNPERLYGASNAGDLNVIATVTDGERTLSGKARLTVTKPLPPMQRGGA